MAHLFLTRLDHKAISVPRTEKLFGALELGRERAGAHTEAQERKGLRKKRRGTFVEADIGGGDKTEMSNGTWLRLAMIILPVGVLTASLGARSIGNTVELTGHPVRVEIPESAELF